MATNNNRRELDSVVIRGQKPDPNEVRIYIGDTVFRGWTSVRITRGIERMPNDFELGMTELYPGEDRMVIVPGSACELYIGSNLVLTGYVDRVVPVINGRQHSIRVSGRGKCQDLVDCSAVWPGGQIVGKSVLEIAQFLAKLYGIEVVGIGDQGGGVPKHGLMWGETAWEVIDRWARIRQLLAYELPTGDLCLHYAGTNTKKGNPFPMAASGFKQGVNIQQAAGNWSADQRYSLYVAHLLPMDPAKEVIGSQGNFIGAVPDPSVGRFRRRDIVAEQVSKVGIQNVKDRVMWEASRRFGRSGAVQIVTDGWRDAAGALYTPGTSVPIDCPAIYKTEGPEREPWVLSEVTYRKDEGGTTCEVLALPRIAFAPQPQIPPVLIPAEFNQPHQQGASRP